jgi:hypothetical protein
LEFFDGISSHIQILNNKGESEIVYFEIPHQFANFSQDKEDEWWISCSKQNASSFLRSLFQKHFQILRYFYIGEFNLTFIFGRFEKEMYFMIEINILILVLVVFFFQDISFHKLPLSYIIWNQYILLVALLYSKIMTNANTKAPDDTLIEKFGKFFITYLGIILSKIWSFTEYRLIVQLPVW